MGIGARAKILVTDHDIKQKRLAEHLGISPAKMSNYLNEKNEMPARVVMGIAQYFHVTTDYLLGLTDTPRQPVFLSGAEAYLIEGFRALNRDQRELITQSIRLMREQNQRPE